MKIKFNPNMSRRRDAINRVSKIDAINRVSTIIVAILIIFCSFTVSAQDTNNELSGKTNTMVLQTNDSLSDYLQIALQNNPLVLQRFAEYKAALERVPQAGALPDPELTAGVFITPMELLAGNQVADLSLMQMFPWFGVLKNAKDEMSLMAKASFESFRDARLQVMLDVKKTWYEMYRLRENLRISEKNLELLKTIEKLSLARYRSGSTGNSAGSFTGSSAMGSGSPTGATSSMGGQSGMGSMGSGGQAVVNQNQPMQQNSMQGGTSGSGLADLYRIQIEEGELLNTIALYKDQQNTLLSKFNSFLNRPPLAPVVLPDTLYADSLKSDILFVPDSIRKNNPMLAMIRFEQQSLDARKEMSKRMGFPMAGIGLNYSVINKNEMAESDMNGSDMIMPMMKITLPVYKKKYKALQNEAVTLKSASEMNYLTTLNNLTNEYYEAVQLYTDAGRRIRLYSEQAALAEKSLNIMIRSYSGASVPLSDLLIVQQQLLDYELLRVQAVTDFNTASAWLKRIMSSEL